MEHTRKHQPLVRLRPVLAALLLLAAGAGEARAQDPPPAQLTLDQAVARALAENPSLEEAQAAIRRAEAAVDEARSFQLPFVSADASLSAQGPTPTVAFGGQSIRLGDPFSQRYSVGAAYEVDAFGRLRTRTELAGGQVEVSRGTLATLRNELVYAVQNVYLAALRAEGLIAVQREALAAAEEQRRVAEAQFRAGVVAEFDVVRASVQVANVEQALLTAEANHRRTLARLAELLSLEPRAALELAPVEIPPAETGDDALPPGQSPPQTLDQALAEAYRQRPEAQRAEWVERIAETRVELERKGKLPALSVGVGGVYTPGATGLGALSTSWSLFANVAVPLWDGGLTRARTRQAAAEAEAARARQQVVRDAIAEEVKQAMIDLEDAAARRATAAANTEQAREALQIARARYNAGLSANVEVVDAEAALTLARANEVNAAYDSLAALAALNRAVGRFAGETEPPA